jgi:hypothetical protein
MCHKCGNGRAALMQACQMRPARWFARSEHQHKDVLYGGASRAAAGCQFPREEGECFDPDCRTNEQERL